MDEHKKKNLVLHRKTAYIESRTRKRILSPGRGTKYRPFNAGVGYNHAEGLKPEIRQCIATC